MQNIVTLGEINDALKIAAVSAAQLADMGFAALANKPICEGLPPEESRRLRNAKLYPAESIGQIRVALAQRLAAPAYVQAICPTFAVHAGDSKVTLHFSSEAEALEFYRTAKFDAGNPGNKTPEATHFDVQKSDNKTPQIVPDERTDLVPGVMRCAKCEFQLVRQVLAVNLGEVFAGDSKTEPCPNDCGPLWPVTWKQYAEQAMDAAESMADRAFAAEKEVKQLRGELSALDAPNLRAKIMSTPLGLYGTGIGDIGIAYRAGHRAALLTAADLVASTVVAAPAAVAVPAAVMGLLEALESMVDVCEGHDFDGAPSDAHMEKARAAISIYRAALAATPEAVPADREDFAWLVVQEACETEPADADDPDCIRILRRDLKTAVLAAFLRGDTNPAAAAPVVLPEPDAVISEVMGLVDEWGMESHLRGAAELDAQHSEATQEEIDCAKDRASKERAAWKAIESKLRALLATSTRLVLDYPWRDRLLDGRELVRDQQGFAEHSELPLLDEGMKPRAFFAALDVEMKHTMAEDDLTMDEYDAMNDAENWSAWTPRPPIGDGWNLVAIFDTEDGPAAWWARAQETTPPAAQDAREFWGVIAPCGEGVFFRNEADARWTQTGHGSGSDGFGVPTIGEAFRESYEDDALDLVRVHIIAAPEAKEEQQS